MRNIGLLLLVSIPVWFAFAVHAQSIRLVTGRITGAEGAPVPGATLRVFAMDSKTPIAYGSSGTDGSFTIRFTPAPGAGYRLVAASLGYETSEAHIGSHADETGPAPFEIRLVPSAVTMKEVLVRSPVQKHSQRGDTLEFRASDFYTKETRKLEDLLRGMTGFELGADGRIRYNGREVDRILIEGEDLAENNYRLVSRNLGAAAIDKVQLVKDFTVDRLMKEVGNSGKVGINVTLSESHRRRPTGSLEAGSGVGGRDWTDNNVVFVGGRLKSLAFLRYNENGDPSDSDMDLHYNGSEGGNSVETEAWLERPVKSGIVPMPPLEKAYVRDNRDFAGYLMASARVDDGIRIRILAGTDRSSTRFAAVGTDRHFMPDGRTWALDQQTRQETQNGNLTVRTELSWDKGRDHTGRWQVNLARNHGIDGFNDIASGAIDDTLTERLASKRDALLIRGEHLVRLGPGRLLKTTVRFSNQRLEQGFDVYTHRLAGLFPFDSLLAFHRQDVSVGRLQGEGAAILHARKGRTDWRTGLRFNGDGQVSGSTGWSARQSDVPLFEMPDSRSEFIHYGFAGFVGLKRRLSKRVSLEGRMDAGPSHIRFGYDNIENTFRFLSHSLNVSFKRQISLARHLTLDVSSERHPPGHEFFHPYPLLSGEATVMWPADRVSAIGRFSIRTHYFSNRFSKGREFAFSSVYSRSNRAYSLGFERSPSFQITYPRPMPTAGILDLRCRFEQFVRGLRLKAGLSGGLQLSNERLYLNSVPGTHRLANLHMRIHAATSFVGRVNLEGSFQAGRMSDRMSPEAGIPVRFSQWAFQGHLKCRLRWSDRFFAAFMHRFHQMGPSGILNALDLHASLVMPHRWRFTLLGHNLLDVGSFSQRVPGMNSYSERGTMLVGRYFQFRAALDF